MLLKDKIEKHLLEIQKPSRYIGGEVGSVIKDKSKVDDDFFLFLLAVLPLQMFRRRRLRMNITM